jgi:hypothetical protein
MKPTALNFQIWNESFWRGQCAGALCDDGIPLRDLRPEDRADPEFILGYNTSDERSESERAEDDDNFIRLFGPDPDVCPE